jgi:undecaprenyl-diphosphooligosaccharide---protein glycotransferase
MLKLQDEQTSTVKLLVFITIAYLFAVSLRFIWIDASSTVPQFYWNDEIMLNNNDGYYFAEGARDILQGIHQENDLSPVHTALSQLTALLAKIIPISFETLILYMPSFLGSLIVIPLILIGRALNQTTMGFIAALIGSIVHSYYNRTMMGYYDTDMLNIVFPVLEMYTLILALTHQRKRYLVPIAISITLYQWWYPQAYTLDTALFLMILGYTLLFDRKNIYFYKISLFILIGILSLPLISKIALALIVYAIFHYVKALPQKIFWLIFAAIVALYFGTGGFDPILSSLKGYLFREETKITAGLSLHYYNVISTVREAGNIPFTVFAERISGHTITFVLSLIGYVLAIIVYRPLLVTLPLVGLGFMAMSAGLRFTIYAVPMMAIGFAYLLVFILQFIEKKWLRNIALITLTLAAIYPNVEHIRQYMTPTVFTTQEVASLDALRKLSSREDYVVTWWDYGYPIRYYADVKTWVDGGKHSGFDNYPASFALTANNAASSAHMMRLFTEYTEKGFNDKTKKVNNFEYMLSNEGFKDPNDFIGALALPEYKTPAKTRDVYLMLPLRMMEIFPTVALFSNLDLTGAEKRAMPFYFLSRGAQDTGKTIELGQGVSIDKPSNTLKAGAQSIPIKAFYQSRYDQNQKLQVGRQVFGTEGLNVIYMATYGQFLVLDDYYLNSQYIQMFVFEQYDPKYFQPVILSPMNKIYKLKI